MKIDPEEKMKKMGKTPIFKLLVSQSIPNMVALLSYSMYQLVNSIFIGKYMSETGMAAMGIFSPIEYLTCTSLPVAFSVGSTALIGPALGRNDIKGANHSLTQYLYWSLFYATIIPLTTLPFQDQFLRFLGATDETIVLAHQYSTILLSCGVLVYTPNGGFLPLLRAENRAVTAMMVQLISSAINVILSLVMFPTLAAKLQLVVPALSTVLSLAATGIYTVANFAGLFKGSVLKFICVKIDWKIILQIIKQAFPQFLNALPNQLGQLIANKQIKKYADAQHVKVLAACVSVYSNLSLVLLQPRQAMYMAFMAILGFNIGAKLHKRVTLLIKVGFWLQVGLISCTTLLLTGLADYITPWFGGSDEFHRLAAQCFRYGAFGYPLGGPLMLCSGVYQMERRPAAASVFQAVRLAFVIVLLYVIPPWLGIEYIFLAFGVSDVGMGVVAVFLYYFIYRKYKKIEQMATERENVIIVDSPSQIIPAVDEGKLTGDA